jgi:hypothetical protein
MKAMIGFLPMLITSVLTTSVTASNIDEVCYTPIRGTALTVCTPEYDAGGNLLQPCPEMLGQFRLVLKKTSDDPENRRLRLAGPLHGITNPDQTLNHVLGDEHASGLIYTFGDTLVEIIPLSECLLHVKEVLNITFGIGKYAGAHGTITIAGELNLCTGVNELDLVRTGDEICFNATTLNQDKDD